jgi:hypothetical protein
MEDYNPLQTKLNQVFGSSIMRLVHWGSFLCGFIADSNSVQMADSQIATITDSQLNSIHENRLELMLQQSTK